MKKIINLILILILVFLIISPILAHAATIGKTTTTGSAPGNNGHYAWAVGPFTMPEDGAATTFHLYTTDEPAGYVTMGIYTDSSGYPGELVAQTAQITMQAANGAGWISGAITTALSSGSAYWLCWRSNTLINIPYETSSYSTKYVSSTYDPVMPGTYPGSASGVARIYAIYLSYTPDADIVQITAPVQYQIFQRDPNDRANISITGTYTGTHTGIEGRFNGGEWATVDNSLSGGVFSGTLLNQVAGQGRLEVRFADDPNTSTYVEYVSVGDVFIIAGQSNHAGRLDNLQSYTHENLKASMYRETGTWAELHDPTDTEGDNPNNYGSIWPLLTTLIMGDQNIPVGFITVADGSTALSSDPHHWKDGGTSFEDCVARVKASGVNSVKAILWLQGEQEAADPNLISSETYENDVSTMLDNMQDPNKGFGIACPMGLAQLLRLTTAAGREHIDNIRLAIANRWDNDPDMFAGPVLADVTGDGIHIWSDADGQTVANRWWHFLKLKFYGGTEGRGPRFLSSAKIDPNQIRVIFTVANPPLINATDTTGWRVVDDTGALIVNSTIAYGTTGVIVAVDRALGTNPKISWGSFNDATGATIKDSSICGLPPEPFVNQVVSIGWGHKISGILPGKVGGVARADIATIGGIE